MMSCSHHYSVTQNSFTALKLCGSPQFIPSPATFGNQWSLHCLCGFAFSRRPILGITHMSAIWLKKKNTNLIIVCVCLWSLGPTRRGTPPVLRSSWPQHQPQVHRGSPAGICGLNKWMDPLAITYTFETFLSRFVSVTLGQTYLGFWLLLWYSAPFPFTLGKEELFSGLEWLRVWPGQLLLPQETNICPAGLASQGGDKEAPWARDAELGSCPTR